MQPDIDSTIRSRNEVHDLDLDKQCQVNNAYKNLDSYK